MSPDPSVEEVLTRTLRRAGELAVPDGLHVPFQIGGEATVSGIGQLEPVLTRPSTRPMVKLAVTGVAAAVVIAVGLVTLIGSSSPTRIQRLQLSASQGEHLLCGPPGCTPSAHLPAGANSAARPISAPPSYGAVGNVPAPVPRDVWVVAADGRFVEAFPGSAVGERSLSRAVPGLVYLSAGAGHFYRFVTGQTGGPLRVVGHNTHSVTLVGADGRRYLLNLRSAELTTPQ